jgi:hypothetical protein
MDDELPLRYRDVTSAAPEKSFQRAVKPQAGFAGRAFFCLLFFPRERKVSRQEAKPGVSDSTEAS